MVKNLSILDLFPLNLNILAPEMGAFQMGPETQNGDFD
jgi:hypothetical protein